ncbi:MAG: nucleotide sugar dehydrogenase [Tindallia sp. MSAO_Bac2]|nr:MAG: nucleotide sugar dehydrogenase [Tindallia sp. MSAO_Bac2]
MSRQFKKICVIGVGYIGLPTAAILANSGYEVVGYDLDEFVVSELNQGRITISEPHLDELVRSEVEKGNLRGSTTIEEADVFSIAVPTPITKDKKADLSYVVAAANSIKDVVKKGNLVVLESTSPPGTVEECIVPILEKSGLNIGEDVFVAHSPERVIPGKILEELVENNRIIGGINLQSSEMVRDLFRSFVKGEMFITDSRTAEMCKLMENTYRDVNIALANELAVICESQGIDAWEVRELSNQHQRVNIHMPGPGVGGHCIAVDPWFIHEKEPEKSPLIHQSRVINDSMPAHVFEKVVKSVGKKGKVAVLGITYKPDVGDLRESPILKLIDMLKKDEANYEIAIHDPFIKEYNVDINTVISHADLVVLGVNHKQYLNVDFEAMHKLMRQKNILDTRGSWKNLIGEDSRFHYTLLGCGKR